MGEVYEAEHVATGRRVALKVMNQKLTSEDDRRRFLREGRLAASVNHPNVVYVYGSEEIEGAPVIAMELVQGGTLKDQLKRDGPLPVTQAVEAILQVIAGLEAAQATGVLHRDIKPANCFVDPDGIVKIGDFGLSVSTFARGESLITAAGSVMGTPAYASPEQLRGQPLDVATDIYSIGATLYHLLTGQPPFHETDFVKIVTEVLDEQPPAPCQLRDGIPDDLSRIVMRCLAKDRGARYQTYGQLRDALLPFRATETVPAPPARRILANILDECLAFAPGFLYFGYWGLEPLDALMGERTLTAALVWLGCYVWYALYYAIWEGRTGAAAGKFLCGLRVVRLDGQVPGFARALYRVVLFSLPNVLPSLLLMAFMPLARMNATLANGGTLITDQLGFLPFLFFVTMRRRNRYAAIHDLLTRTRVVVSPKSQPRPMLMERAIAPMAEVESASVPCEILGPYQIRASLWKTPLAELIEAFDPALRRRIWIHLRPSTADAVSTARRDLNRPARLRWLNGGRTETHLWDAYEAGDGTPFLKLRGKPQPWSSVRFWLLDLAEEMAAALKQGTVLPVLSLNRLWISRHGRAFILDFPCPGLDNELNETLPDPLRNEADMQRFLNTVAGEALTMGKNKPAVPLHARAFLQSLERHSFPEPEFVVGNLQSLVSKPGRITPHWRAASLALAPAIIVGLAISVVTAAGFAQFRWQRQWTALYPGLPSLRAAATLYDLQVSRDEDKDSQKDLELARVYLASHFGQLLTNDALWANQALTKDFDEADLEADLRQAVSGPKPTPQMSREADTVIAPRINLAQRSELCLLFLIMLIFLAGMFSLLELFGAIFFRQSPVLSLFGIAIVDRQNGPAGRLRLFWRWTIKWISFGALGVLGVALICNRLMMVGGSWSPAPPASVEQLIPLPSIIVISVVAVAILACFAHTVFHPERSLADRLAGTRLAPK